MEVSARLGAAEPLRPPGGEEGNRAVVAMKSYICLKRIFWRPLPSQVLVDLAADKADSSALPRQLAGG